MSKQTHEPYVDAKGRTRWRRNDLIGEQLKQLHDVLVIGGYDELHARRYPQLAHTISRHPESIVAMHEAGRLSELPGVSGTIAQIIAEFIETGSCTKLAEWAKSTPLSVLELTAIDRLGAMTARTLFAEHGIDSLASLVAALEAGELDSVKGIGPKMKERIREHAATKGL